MIKILIVIKDPKPLEKLLNDGYALIGAHAYNYGLLVILRK